MQSYGTRGIFFLILGAMFVFLAVQDVRQNEFGPFTYILILIATLDVGTGLRMLYKQMKLGKSAK